MGKRSEFIRREKDFYPTPPEAVKPLLPYLNPHTRYIEPCVGQGHMVAALAPHGHECVGQYDLPTDVCTTTYNLNGADCFITNPPWDRSILHPAIENLRRQAPTWLLFDADWAHTKQASNYLKYCHTIISVGRVKWISDSKHTGKDNAAWYFFVGKETETFFIGR